MNRRSRRDLNGKVWRLAGPIIVANLSVPLLGAVDTAVVGHLPSPRFLGAVALGAVLFNFLYWGFGFLRMGTTGLTAQAFGGRQSGELGAVLGRSLFLALVIGVALWALQLPLLAVAIHLFQASPEVENLAETYFQIRIWSAPAALANYCLIGWFVGVQNTRMALVLQLWMNGLNILLDVLFVVVLGWGVAGVAGATVIAEYSAVAAGLLLLRRQRLLNGRWFAFSRVFDRRQMTRMLSVNKDIFVRTLCLIFAFAYFTSEAGALGDAALATTAVLMQFQHFLSYGLDGFAHAAEALIGSAVGAGDKEYFRSAVTVSGIWALALSILFAAAYWAAGPILIDLLTGISEVRLLARELLIWIVISPILSVWSYMLEGIFIGATRTRDMRNAMIISLGAFLAAVWTLKPAYGLDGLWAALMVFMVVRALTLGAYYPGLERSLTGDPRSGK